MRKVYNVKDKSNPYLALMAWFPVAQRPIAYASGQYLYRNPQTSVCIRRRIRRVEK